MKCKENYNTNTLPTQDKFYGLHCLQPKYFIPQNKIPAILCQERGGVRLEGRVHVRGISLNRNSVATATPGTI